MKRIITAVGNEELNKILKRQKEIIIENPDIQYQEGIIEALEKYKETDIVILSEKIIGALELEDLIRNIIIIKNDVKIILITEKNFKQNENIIRIINDNKNYEKEILEFLLGGNYIKNENQVSQKVKQEKPKIKNEEIKREVIFKQSIKRTKEKNKINIINSFKEKVKKIFANNKDSKKIIMVIGCAGVR